ncbi:hypothetical protein B566_EDAN005571 [Ephemera danica]|nr:hypothetical protein B566_EDAN005571 [Ephemera danica]
MQREEIVEECTAAAQQQGQVGHTRRRRRKNHGPYDGVLVSQLLAQRDRLVQHPPSASPCNLPPPPPLQQQHQQQQQHNMPPRVSEANSYPMWRFQGWDAMNQMHQLPPPPPPPSLPPQAQLQFPPPPPLPQQHQQLRPPCHSMVPSQQMQQQQQQFRQYSPAVTTTSSSVMDPRVQHKQQVMYNQFGDAMAKQQQQQQQRPPPPPYMAQYNSQGFNYQPQAPMVVNNQQPATSQWNNPCPNMYDREVPLHRLSWDDVSKRKKLKSSKRVKLTNQCPNVDVRHIPMDKLPPQQAEVQQSMSFVPPQQQQQPAEQNLPSFMEDPNGYLAQQTALLNSTILRQTGVNMVRPVTSLESSPSSSSPLSTIVPLPSNVIVSSKGRGTPQNSPVIFSQANSVSSSYTSQPLSLPDSASECQACSMNNAVAALYQAATVKADVVLSPPEENPVTSSTLTQDKASPNPDPKGPIQGGTVSTSEMASHKTETVPSPSSSAECPCEVTTVVSGHTVSSNTVTSVQAGRAQTVTVTVSNPTSPTFPVTVSKSPLEMVQSVVSSIQVPPPPMQPQQAQIKLENSILDHSQLLKSGLPPGHILVSSNGQLIMATQPQKMQPPVSTSQMLSTMNMGQPMMQLVNALPCNTPLLLQSGMLPQTVTVEGMGSPLQLTLTGNVLHQGQLTPDMSGTDMLGLGHKKKGKKRSKSSPQQQQQQQQNVASMLQLHNSPMLMQNFQTIPTQQQAPLLQTVTILPNNKTQFLQFPSTNQQQGNGSQQSPQQQAQQQFGNLGGHLLTSPQNSINLIQPFNLLNSAGGFVPNFPLQQILQGGTTLVMPSLQGLQGMVTLPDGTLMSPDPNHGTVQLQLQNVNGQQVLTSVQSQNMFGAQQNLIATPGMVIRAPAPQTQVISNKITNQVISQNGQLISPQSQFLVNGAFTQQTALNGLMVNTGQQVTLTPQNSSPNQRGPDFIQCMNMNGQPMIIPCSSSQATVPTSQSQQNQAAATLLQQNTTIVQQQTTLVANNQQNNATNAIMNPNFILNSNLLQKPFQELTMPLLLQKHSVSTQTAGAQTQTMVPGVASVPVTQVATLALSSPPDTTTHQAPADTTTASPLCESMKPGTPTADFVSSSEPDPETYAWANRTLAALTAEEEVESSTKQPAAEEKRLVSCKRKHSDLLVIEARPEPTQELEDPADSVQSTGPRNLAVGDLVWGPARGFPSWPGKLVALETTPTETAAAAAPLPSPSSSPLSERMVWVRWFGDVTTPSQVQLRLLKTLSEGLEAHHRATKKLRKGRKMNSQLESAIQEAMTDLDLMTKLTGTNEASSSNPRSCSKKSTR